MSYLEPVRQVATAVTGFSPGKADLLRRAMSRRRSFEAMQEFWEDFRTGAQQRGIDAQTAERIFRKLLGFTEFGFPKSHAAAFGLLAYQSNWLRVYYPTEYLCALINAQPMGFYSPEVLAADAQRHGVAVLPPDINRSGPRCTPEGDAVRLGLSLVRALGEPAAEAIVRERERNGPFVSLFDLSRCVPLRREAIEALVEGGAFDWTGLGRRELLWQVGLFSRPVTWPADIQRPRQLSLPLPTVQDEVAMPEMSA